MLNYDPINRYPILLAFRISNEIEILFYFRNSNSKYSVEGAQCHNIQWLPSKLINTLAYAEDTLVISNIYQTNLEQIDYFVFAFRTVINI